MRVAVTCDSDGEVVAIVWWTGSTIEASSARFLRSLEQRVVDGRGFDDGKEFFDRIPNIYKSGYLYTRGAKVDAAGNLL